MKTKLEEIVDFLNGRGQLEHVTEDEFRQFLEESEALSHQLFGDRTVPEAGRRERVTALSDDKPPGVRQAVPRLWLSLGLAASLLVCFGLGWLAHPNRSGEVLLTQATPQYPSSRSAPSAESISPDVRGIYPIRRATFQVALRSPRAGWATIVVLTPSHSYVFPRREEKPIHIEKQQLKVYGPLPRPDERAAVLVIVTDAPAAEEVRQTLSVLPSSEQPEEFVERIKEVITGHYPWAAIGYFLIEPRE